MAQLVVTCLFFFSSRRRHTRWPRDWSSDVCSSDLPRCASGCVPKASSPAISTRGSSQRSWPRSSSAGGRSCAPRAPPRIDSCIRLEDRTMLTREQNDQLTRTDRGTLMGNLFRRYWIPALHGWEIAEPDSAPVRVQLLGEKLVAFRDSKGRIGVIDEFCAHRSVS